MRGEEAEMSPQEDAAKARLAGLLKRVQVQPDAAPTTLQGRAVSRSDGNLHLATSTGLVAIPIDTIEDVTPLLASGDPNLVSVSVNDHAKVRHLLKLKLTGEDGEGGGATRGTGFSAASGPRADHPGRGKGGRQSFAALPDC